MPRLIGARFFTAFRMTGPLANEKDPRLKILHCVQNDRTILFIVNPICVIIRKYSKRKRSDDCGFGTFAQKDC